MFRSVRYSIAAILTSALPLLAQDAATPVLIHGARVFDGTRLLGVRDVLIRNGRIERIAVHLPSPPGAAIVDGKGKTLLPGLIDSHTHTWGDAPTQALAFGVTTELDIFTDWHQAAAWRAEQRKGNVFDRADVFSAGTLVTAPKGHGTEYGMVIPTISSPDSAQEFVDARIAEGSDYIKIISDDGHVYGLTLPTLSKATIAAVVRAAHKRGKMAVAHIGSLQEAREAIDAGVDGLAHTFVDVPPDEAFGRFVAAHNAFVIPTLTVNLSVTGVGGAATLSDDPRMAPYLTSADIAALKHGFPRHPGLAPLQYSNAEQSVRALKAAKVPLLAGTDAPNPGTAHGAALHRELELLVKAGLTPTEALASATSVPARIFKLADRGTIAPGMRADLLLVKGDPTRDILTTRDIVAVWKDGRAFDRAAYAAQAAKTRTVGTVSAAVQAGDISDFEDGTSASRFGQWVNSTDAIAGGRSEGSFAVVDGGANGTKKALTITGQIAGPLPFAWAGAMFMPGSAPMEPTNLSAKKSIHFWAKGDGKTYRVMLFAQSKGMNPLTRTFTPSTQWTEFDMPFADFGTDGRDVLGILFAGGPQPGAFSLYIDEVRLK